MYSKCGRGGSSLHNTKTSSRKLGKLSYIQHLLGVFLHSASGILKVFIYLTGAAFQIRAAPMTKEKNVQALRLDSELLQ